MDLKTAKAFPVPRKKPKRIGRGPSSGHGKTSTKGHKGQRARSGTPMRRPFEGGQMPLFRRLPKRGFSNKRFRPVPGVVNVEDLAAFSSGAVVDVPALQKAGFLKHAFDRVKILGTGDLSVSLTVRANGFSASAKEKIEKAGGKAEIVSNEVAGGATG